MNYVPIGFITVICLLLSYIGLRLINVVHTNFRTASELRNQFAQRIRLLPMYRMLRLRGIELNKLLHNLPVAEIESGIRKCESCNKDKICETALKEKVNHDFSFCPNDSTFIESQKLADPNNVP